MFKYWVREKGKEPPCFCPIEEDSIVLGMNLVADHPPGKLVGEFTLTDDGILVEFYDEESPNG